MFLTIRLVQLLTKLQEASDSVKDQIMELVATLAEKEREILECQDNLQHIKSHATDLQTFLGLKQIEAEITKNHQFHYLILYAITCLL
jgi:Leu/Phe-tRNA-protein transferase